MSYIKTPLREVREGRGARVKRLFPTGEVRNFDPFVLFDHFVISPPAGFPDHPHKGFEIITLVLEGALKHGDSLGNSEVIKGIGIQKITAGRGIVHSEMPADEDTVEGIQVWVNLPRVNKNIDPAYTTIGEEEIPLKANGGVKEYIIAGEDTRVKFFTPVDYYLLFMEGDRVLTKRFAEERNTIIYPLEGEVETGNIEVSEGTALLACRTREVSLRSKRKTKLVIVSGRPIGEPIIQKGPFVY